MAKISIEHLRKNFGDFVAVEDSSFVINDGEFFVMLGPSGCGKTTTLRMIAGLEIPTSGRILLDGEDVTYNRASQRDIAFVFQLFALYPHMNVRRNIGFPLKCQGVPRAKIRTRVEETARLLQIDHLLDKSVSSLAGGDRQRVALGRAIVRRPKAFLMDEPLGTLDSEFRNLMCQELRELHNRIDATTVYVTHDQIEAMSMGDKIAVMNHGIIEQFGEPQDIYNHPVSMYVADFIGSPSMNFLNFHAQLNTGDTSIMFNGGKVQVPEIRQDVPESDLVLGVRPEHIILRDNAALRGQVLSSEYLGTNQIVTIKTEYGIVKARESAEIEAKTGEPVGLDFRSGYLTLFEQNTGKALKTAFNQGVAHG